MTSEQLEMYLNRLGRALRTRGVLDARIVDEARAHLVDAVEEGLQRGLPPDAGEREALARFGAPDTVAAHFASERYQGLNRILGVVCSFTARDRLSQAADPRVAPAPCELSDLVSHGWRSCGAEHVGAGRRHRRNVRCLDSIAPARSWM